MFFFHTINGIGKFKETTVHVTGKLLTLTISIIQQVIMMTATIQKSMATQVVF